ncbi:MAG: type II CAAX prenyl endopeptidase Rce1 family protein [Promethearchaeota archaeon]
MRKHDVTNALIEGNNRKIILIFLPLTMIMEELIFRYYLIGILINSLNLDDLSVIFISSLIFSLYHFHAWFSYKNRTLLLVNLIYPFLMGLYLGYMFLSFGIIFCILIHYLLVFYLYYNISKRYFRNNILI